VDVRKIARLRALLSSVYPTDWHTGRTVGRTLYCGDGPDDMIGTMDTRMLAEMVVLCREYAREHLITEPRE
jgi:hypothetical protein